MEILSILWSRGPSTVRDVHNEICRRKPAQHTTVLKFMQIMAEKGLVRRDERLFCLPPAGTGNCHRADIHRGD